MAKLDLLAALNGSDEPALPSREQVSQIGSEFHLLLSFTWTDSRAEAEVKKSSSELSVAKSQTEQLKVEIVRLTSDLASRTLSESFCRSHFVAVGSFKLPCLLTYPIFTS